MNGEDLPTEAELEQFEVAYREYKKLQASRSTLSAAKYQESRVELLNIMVESSRGNTNEEGAASRAASLLASLEMN